LLGSLTLLLLTIPPPVFAAAPDAVKLDTGLISGVAGTTPEVRVFKGVPFAAPPVGDLRWREPKAPAHWEGTHAADKFGPQCMQNAPGGPPAEGVSEDCLYLNVWTAAAARNGVDLRRRL